MLLALGDKDCGKQVPNASPLPLWEFPLSGSTLSTLRPSCHRSQFNVQYHIRIFRNMREIPEHLRDMTKVNRRNASVVATPLDISLTKAAAFF